MKRRFFLFFVIFLFCKIGFSQSEYAEAKKYLQTRGEVYFQFQEQDNSKIRSLSQVISIDKKKGSLWFAYANDEEFDAFLKQNYQYSILTPPSLSKTKASISMAGNVLDMANWDSYPSYPVYLSLMQKFSQDYPNLCSIDTIGYSVNGRLILATKIARNVNEENLNPEFFYSASMHGDELTGFVLMLRLIDYLLKYSTNNQFVSNLIEKVQIYINPLANPDGAYKFSNNDVSGATRYNANNIDLNRNFPDPFRISSINLVQPENRAMIQYFEKHKFVLSANLHGGAEVINYPWDSFEAIEKSTADADWWEFISRSFVDTCWKTNSNCFRDVDNTGITNGGDWYVVSNGRQDYVNAYHYCREMTMEISSEKLLPSNQLNTYWEHLHKSFLYYIEQVTYGIKGIVTDSITKEPLQARVLVRGHDTDSSYVYSFLPFGNYSRLLKAGNYSVRFSSPGYKSKTVDNISVRDFEITLLHIQLNTGEDDIRINVVEDMKNSFIVFPNPSKEIVNIVSQKKPIAKIELFDLKSNLLFTERVKSTLSTKLNRQAFNCGVYILKVYFSDQTIAVQKIIFGE